MTDYDAIEAALALMSDDDPHHPLTVLGTWELMLREDYGHPSHERITIASAAGYLDRMLHRLANDPEQDWALFAEEIAACRKHLEAVLHDQRFGDLGAGCYMCGEARVEKTHREQRHVGCTSHRRNGCVHVDRAGYCLDARGGRIPDDGWKCTNKRCGAEYAPRDYEAQARERYVLMADALTLQDMAERTGVTYSTLRRWASTTHTQKPGEPVVEHKPKIRPAFTEAGRKMYRVADVERVQAEYGTTDVADATVSTEAGLAAPKRVS